MTTFTNRYGMAGKIIAGIEADSTRPVAYIVRDDDTSDVALQNLAEYLRRFNGKHVRITIEHDVDMRGTPAQSLHPGPYCECDMCQSRIP